MILRKAAFLFILIQAKDCTELGTEESFYPMEPFRLSVGLIAKLRYEVSQAKLS